MSICLPSEMLRKLAGFSVSQRTASVLFGENGAAITSKTAGCESLVPESVTHVLFLSDCCY